MCTTYTPIVVVNLVGGFLFIGLSIVRFQTALFGTTIYVYRARVKWLSINKSYGPSRDLSGRLQLRGIAEKTTRAASRAISIITKCSARKDVGVRGMCPVRRGRGNEKHAFRVTNTDGERCTFRLPKPQRPLSFENSVK